MTAITPKQTKYLEGQGKTVLVIEDQPDPIKFLNLTLQHQGFDTKTVGNARDAVELLNRNTIDCIVCNVRLMTMDGVDLLNHATKSIPTIPVILITNSKSKSAAYEATKKGVFDYLEKPLETSRFLVTLRNALAQRQLLQRKLEVPEDTFSRYGLIGNSSVMKNLFYQIERVADTQSRVIIMGETGTGKELVARALHRLSNQMNGPFVAVNCAAIPKDLIESLLFGHRKGAFTGAIDNYSGKFAEADGGSLFLDEIAELPLYAQAKLLRAVEFAEVEPVGGSPTKVDVRLLVATQRPLRKAVQLGKFREDLFHRLHVIELVMPTLRERREDIGLLANYFFKRFVGLCNRTDLTRITAQAIRTLSVQPWPGNVRELEHIIERAVLFSDGPEITAGDIDDALDDPGAEPTPVEGLVPSSDLTYREAKEQFEKKFLSNVLRQHKGSVVSASKSLGIDRTSLWRKMKRHNL